MLYIVYDKETCRFISIVSGSIVDTIDTTINDIISIDDDEYDKYSLLTNESVYLKDAGIWATKPFNTIESDRLIQLDYIRKCRNKLLQDSDWTQLQDIPAHTQEVWRAYRQTLRDITINQPDPFNIIWPEPPQ